MRNPLIIWRNWLHRWICWPNVSYSMCNCCGATTTADRQFLRKTTFYNEKFYFKFRGAVKWGLKIFAANYQKAHPYAKSGRTNRLAYVAVTLFWHYITTTSEKKYARIAIGNSMSSITLRRYRDVVILVEFSVFQRGWVNLTANFRWKGASLTNFCWCQKTRVITLSYRNIGTMFFRFVAKQACDGQTDRKTDGHNYDPQYRAS